MSGGPTYVPMGHVLQLPITTVPVRLYEVLQGMGLIKEKADGTLQKTSPIHRVIEIRVLDSSNPFLFTIVDPDIDGLTETTAQYITIPAGETVQIPVDNAHEKVYFKSGSTDTLHILILGTDQELAPI